MKSNCRNELKMLVQLKPEIYLVLIQGSITFLIQTADGSTV